MLKDAGCVAARRTLVGRKILVSFRILLVRSGETGLPMRSAIVGAGIVRRRRGHLSFLG
jgi:hypothetical protein